MLAGVHRGVSDLVSQPQPLASYSHNLHPKSAVYETELRRSRAHSDCSFHQVLFYMSHNFERQQSSPDWDQSVTRLIVHNPIDICIIPFSPARHRKVRQEPKVDIFSSPLQDLLVKACRVMPRGVIDRCTHMHHLQIVTGPSSQPAIPHLCSRSRSSTFL